jgi:hypothetical protein
MEKHQDKLRLAAIALFCLLNIGFGFYAWQMPMLLGGAGGLVYVAVAALPGRNRAAKSAETPLA